MKVVVNRCFGGFGLSAKAMKRLIEEGSPGIKVMLLKEYGGEDDLRGDWYEDAGDGFVVGFSPDVLCKDGKVYHWNDENRTDPVLLRVIEELGPEANNSYSDLEIVDIPDGTEYTIENYDGQESIHKAHRSW